MEFRYFVEVNSTLSQLRKELIEEEEKELGDRSDFATRYGGKLCFGTGSRVSGIAVNIQDRKPEGFKLLYSEMKSEEGKLYRVYVPDRRTKLGRQAHAEMLKLRKTAFSDKVIRRLNLGSNFFDVIERYIKHYTSSAFLVGKGEKEYLAARVPLCEASKELKCPEGMIEIKKSSWVALTEEGSDIPELKT